MACNDEVKIKTMWKSMIDT